MKNRLLPPPAGGTRRQFQIDRPSQRSETQRDRDRVLYSTAFKRLGHVTQVTASETGLTFHSRLTHSLKVAQFARRLAERLKGTSVPSGARRVVTQLDVDAAEAAALAHDIGHPPFGHLAERKLDELAEEFGGFEGNAQSFRIVTRLALQSREHPGLNLTRKTLNGILKYPRLRNEEDTAAKWNAYGSDKEAFAWAREGRGADDARTVEAEIMDWADDVTYAVHDMDDFYRAGIVPLERLCNDPLELRAFQDYILDSFPEDRHGARARTLIDAADSVFHDLLFGIIAPYSGTVEDRVAIRSTGSSLITRYIDDPRIVAEDGDAFFVIDDDLRSEVAVLKQLIWFYVIERPSLGIIQNGQKRIVEELFTVYEAAALDEEWRLFPTLYAERLRSATDPKLKRRIVVDLISSMTESSAIEVYRRMTGVVGASISDPTGRIT